MQNNTYNNVGIDNISQYIGSWNRLKLYFIFHLSKKKTAYYSSVALTLFHWIYYMEIEWKLQINSHKNNALLVAKILDVKVNESLYTWYITLASFIAYAAITIYTSF